MADAEVEMTRRDYTEALVCGAVGASALTALHQLARAVTDVAPRMDLVGMRALTRAARGAGAEPPPRPQLYGLTLAGDMLANSAYYALAALGSKPRVWWRGAALGAAAGAGALLLPPRMGLGDPPHSEHFTNKIMTVAWYVVGGLATAAAATWRYRRQYQ